MTYRIHFTIEDLARTKVAKSPLPLFELELAARALQDRSRPVGLDAWRREARAHLSVESRMALSLMPAVGWTLTFLSPALAGPAEEALEQVRATPRRQIREQLAELVSRQTVPSWAGRLAEDRETREQVYQGMQDLWDVLLARYWPRITGVLSADRSLRMRHFADAGVEGLLAQVNPRWMRWNPPVLEVRMANGVDHDLHLQGRGLLLVPSLFAIRSLIDDATEPQPTLSYPFGEGQPLNRLTTLAPSPHSTVSPGVSTLLGSTRSAVLHTIAEHPACSTKELAALVGIAPASASEHATALRGAGLIRTSRHRNTALHTPTSLGIALLNGPGC